MTDDARTGRRMRRQIGGFELPSRTRVAAPGVLVGPARRRCQVLEARREGRHLLVLDRVEQVPVSAGRGREGA